MSLFFLFASIINISREFLDLGGDSAQYIILAEALSKGFGYRAVNYPNSPFFYYYPPFFSLLLCPIVYFFGRNFYLMHILVIILGFLSLFFLYNIFKRYIDKKLAFFITILSATNWVFIIYSTKYILSDIPYLFLSTCTLFFLSKYLLKDNFLNKEGFLTLLGLILSYFTRYAGITLFLGILAVLLLSHNQRVKKVGFIFIGFLLFFLLWQITCKILNPSSLYSHSKQLFLIDPYRPFLGTIFSNPKYLLLRLIQGVNYYYEKVGYIFFFYFINKWDFLTDYLSLISIILIFLGLWIKFYQDKTCVFHYYFLFYFLLIIFWPFREGVRFLLPTLPFMYFYFFIALKKVVSSLGQKISHSTFYILLFAFIIFNSISLLNQGYTYQDSPKYHKNFIYLHQWVKENLSQEGLFFSRKPTITYFYTNHISIVYPFTLNPKAIWDEVLKNDIKYIIVDEFSRETHYYLLPFLNKYRDKIELLQSIGDTKVFEVLGR